MKYDLLARLVSSIDNLDSWFEWALLGELLMASHNRAGYMATGHLVCRDFCWSSWRVRPSWTADNTIDCKTCPTTGMVTSSIAWVKLQIITSEDSSSTFWKCHSECTTWWILVSWEFAESSCTIVEFLTSWGLDFSSCHTFSVCVPSTGNSCFEVPGLVIYILGSLPLFWAYWHFRFRDSIPLSVLEELVMIFILLFIWPF